MAHWLVCARCGLRKVLDTCHGVLACPQCGDRGVEAVELPRPATQPAPDWRAVETPGHPNVVMLVDLSKFRRYLSA